MLTWPVRVVALTITVVVACSLLHGCDKVDSEFELPLYRKGGSKDVEGVAPRDGRRSAQFQRFPSKEHEKRGLPPCFACAQGHGLKARSGEESGLRAQLASTEAALRRAVALAETERAKFRVAERDLLVQRKATEEKLQRCRAERARLEDGPTKKPGSARPRKRRRPEGSIGDAEGSLGPAHSSESIKVSALQASKIRDDFLSQELANAHQAKLDAESSAEALRKIIEEQRKEKQPMLTMPPGESSAERCKEEAKAAELQAQPITKLAEERMRHSDKDAEARAGEAAEAQTHIAAAEEQLAAALKAVAVAEQRAEDSEAHAGEAAKALEALREQATKASRHAVKSFYEAQSLAQRHFEAIGSMKWEKGMVDRVDQESHAAYLLLKESVVLADFVANSSKALGDNGLMLEVLSMVRSMAPSLQMDVEWLGKAFHARDKAERAVDIVGRSGEAELLPSMSVALVKMLADDALRLADGVEEHIREAPGTVDGVEERDLRVLGLFVKETRSRVNDARAHLAMDVGAEAKDAASAALGRIPDEAMYGPRSLASVAKTLWDSVYDQEMFKDAGAAISLTHAAGKAAEALKLIGEALEDAKDAKALEDEAMQCAVEARDILDGCLSCNLSDRLREQVTSAIEGIPDPEPSSEADANMGDAKGDDGDFISLQTYVDQMDAQLDMPSDKKA